jgi:aspartyl/asparaginyl-tRNA synthetase
MSVAYQVCPPRSWRDPQTHFLKATQDTWYHSLVALQDSLTTATVRYWSERGVRFGHLPVTTGSVSSPMGLGSDSSPVRVDLAGVPTYLADSMQFGLEYLTRLAGNGAYYLMPSFRGESNDPTHLSQFFHSEAEIRGGLDDVLAVVESYVRQVTSDLLTDCGEQIELIAGDVSHVERMLADERPFRRLTFDEAVTRLGGAERYVTTDPVHHWRTLTRAGEQELMRLLGDFVWVTHWDHLAVPFYQAFDETGRYALNGDLLFGPGEVVGAGERHTTGEEALAALRRHRVSADTYSWYVAMKDTSPLRTAGFGMGVERYLMWLLRQDDIRDFQIFLRDTGKNLLP